MGNILEIESIERALENIQEAFQKIQNHEKKPVMLGGEHTVTLGAINILRPDLVINFDAHLDLRDRLLGLELSHGTYLRRACEDNDCKLIIIGVRALSQEEKIFAESREDRIQFITSSDLASMGSRAGIEVIQEWLEASKTAYLTIDMDVLDPSYAPAVANPVPEGIGVTTLLDVLCGIVDERLLGFDLTEVSPYYDYGLTSIQAAHIVLETMYCIELCLRA
jgi:arginase family enzyme